MILITIILLHISISIIWIIFSTFSYCFCYFSFKILTTCGTIWHTENLSRKQLLIIKSFLALWYRHFLAENRDYRSTRILHLRCLWRVRFARAAVLCASRVSQKRIIVKKPNLCETNCICCYLCLLLRKVLNGITPGRRRGIYLWKQVSAVLMFHVFIWMPDCRSSGII